jgi:hypothetical protein
MFRKIVWLTGIALAIAGGGLSAETLPFQPGPLTVERVSAAAAAAGFKPLEVTADIPAAARSGFRFVAFDYDDPRLVALREKYSLEKLVAEAPDEWSAQLLLKEWIYQRIPGGNPRSSPATAQEILELAAKGERFYCTQYAITYAECAQALGWQARKIGVDRKHGPEGMQSTHHGAAEVWSNQFRKWVVMDSQSNLHFEKKGVPLSAWDIRAEWLKNGGAEVNHVVGVPPKSVTKNPAIVWWNRPDEDETATYFWIYITDHTAPGTGVRHILPLDDAHAGAVWYQNDSGGSRLHIGYTKNQFMPTRRLEDAYWTVGIVEAQIVAASRGVIRMSLDSYDPNRTGYEVSFDGKNWTGVADQKSLAWTLKSGWNTLRLRTAARRGITGAETAIVMLLDGGS